MKKQTYRLIIIYIIMNISPRKLIQEPQMRSCSSHLSNKNVLSNFRNESKLKDWSFVLAGRSFQIVGPQTLNDLSPNSVLFWFLECTAALGWHIATVSDRVLQKLRCSRLPDKKVPVHSSIGTSEWRYWKLFFAHWQPMKVTQHWRDVIVFPSTSDEPCCRVLDTLQTSQELPADTVQ